jgi:rhodanese-related sulfurtransferase
MNNKKYIILIVMLLAAAVFIAAGGRSENGPDYTDQQVIEDLLKNPPDNFHIVDVRTPEEYRAGHIPSAVNIPLSTIEENPPTENKDALIIVYCRTGNRSGQAERILESQGYTDVHNFGGILDWEGRTVTGGEPGKFVQP